MAEELKGVGDKANDMLNGLKNKEGGKEGEKISDPNMETGLTGVKSAIFALDNTQYYQAGTNVSTYDFMYKKAEAKDEFPEARKLLDKKAATPGELDSSDNAKIKTLEGMVTKAKKSLDAEKDGNPKTNPQLETDIPTARFIEAANAYYGAGGPENKAKGDLLVDYAIQQSKMPETKSTSSNLSDSQLSEVNKLKKKATTQLEAFKEAIQEYYDDGKEKDKAVPKVMNDPKMDALLANADQMQLARDTNASLPKLAAAAAKTGGLG